MQLDIITPDKTIFEGEATSVKLPGIDGSFEVLNDHAPLISALSNGNIRVIDADNSTQEFPIKSGVIEVQRNKVIILAEGVKEE